MASGVSEKPIIVRIANGQPVWTWRFRLAGWMRTLTARLDPCHTIVIVTDDLRLMQHAIDGCVKLMWQKQAAEQYAANESFIQACALQNWQPDDEGRPQ